MLKVVSSSLSNERLFVPLKTVDVQVNIHTFAAEVSIKQIFHNNIDAVNPIEAVYCFPIEEHAAIYSFQATIDDGRKIQARIEEKKKAQREYCQALRQGHGAFLMEQDEKSNDIFTISVGSLKPQSTCEIEIHYVQELDLINDGQRIQFVLPTVIAPRYSSSSGGIQSPANTNIQYVQSAPYTITFACLISSLPIASVGSPSHPIQVSTRSMGTTSNPSMEVSLSQENTHLDRDIILNIDLKQERILTYTLIEKQAMMISLVPTLELCGEQMNCEYIFVVDCSGSMQEESKIDYARQAMSIFLKSLPMGSYFNIFRFGSKYERFQKKEITVEYNEEIAKQASVYINRMQADLGGTELYSVLSHLHSQPPRTNYSRQIFLLTDGEISDVDQVLRLCQSMSNTTRIYSFGLGSSPSRALVKGLARVTNGSPLFISPNTHVDVAVARQLDKALEPCLVNIKVQCHFNDNQLTNYRISPKSLPPVHAKQRLNVYVMMPKPIEGKLTGTIDFLTDKNQLLERVTLTDTEPSSSSLMATRLAAKSIITDLQIEDYSSPSSQQARFIEQEQADKKQEIIDLSIQHQILSPFTAFIAVETRTDEEKASAEKITLCEVPIETPARYNQQLLIPNYHSCLASPIANSYSPTSPAYCSTAASMYDELDCDDEEDKMIDNYSMIVPHPSLSSEKNVVNEPVHIKPIVYGLDSIAQRKRFQSRSRSRSRSPRRRSKSPAKQVIIESADTSDSIRSIISLQNFGGLWEMNHLDQLISHLQQNSAWKNTDLKKICEDHSNKDQNVVLTMMMMFILEKYFPDDEVLWKPIIKKSVKAMKGKLAANEYDQLSAEIQPLI